MPDETHNAIDRLFDVIDRAVDSTDRVLNRSKYTEEQLRVVARRSEGRKIIDAESSPKPKAKAKEASSIAVAKKPHFYIVESVDPKSGSTIFIVTDGGNARTECSTREFAAQILRALEKAL